MPSTGVVRFRERDLGLFILALGLAVFIGVHLVTTRRKFRAGIIARIGEGPYKGLYSLGSLLGLVLIIYGFGIYRATGWINVWYPPVWTRHVAAPLVWIAIICIVATYIRGDIARKLKHPMLVGIKLWAVAHLIANGDLGSMLLFGAILAWAVYDRISFKYRSDPGHPPIPTRGRTNDVIAVAVGTVLFLVLGFYFHPYVVGVPVF